MFTKVTAGLMAMSLLLSACAGAGGQGGGGGGGGMELAAIIAQLTETYPPETARGEGVGGILNYGLVSASHFAGLINPVFAISADDGTIRDFAFTDFLHLVPGNMLGHNGPAWFEYDVENATFTMHFHDDTVMYWHDGVPVTMYDLEFAVMTIAHPATASPRFSAENGIPSLLGMDEYRAGTTDTIAGIQVFNNGRSIQFSYTRLIPAMLFGVHATPIPRHIWENIPFAEMEDHAHTRSNIIGNGPFIIQNIVPGESVALVRNDNYWLGAPKLDGINIRVIHPDLIGEAMLAGTFDLVHTFPDASINDYIDRATNFAFYSTLNRRFDFMGFRFGFFDHATSTITHNPDTIINCIHLRRAIGYSRDEATVADSVFHGFRFPISTTLIPWQGDFMRTDMAGFIRFDLDYANQILDDAGYTWHDGEQFRRLPNGEQFELVWIVADSPAAQTTTPHHQQNWAQVGLNVVLYEGGLVEFNHRITTLDEDLDRGTIHMYDAAWLKGSNPNPAALWGPTSPLNDTRYYSDRLSQILDNIESDQAWDQEWLIQQYFDWQLAVYEEVPWIPLLTNVRMVSVNNRVLNFSLERGDGIREVSYMASHLWDLSRDTPYVR